MRLSPPGCKILCGMRRVSSEREVPNTSLGWRKKNWDFTVKRVQRWFFFLPLVLGKLCVTKSKGLLETKCLLLVVAVWPRHILRTINEKQQIRGKGFFIHLADIHREKKKEGKKDHCCVRTEENQLQRTVKEACLKLSDLLSVRF